MVYLEVEYGCIIVGLVVVFIPVSGGSVRYLPNQCFSQCQSIYLNHRKVHEGIVIVKRLT